MSVQYEHVKFMTFRLSKTEISGCFDYIFYVRTFFCLIQ